MKKIAIAVSIVLVALVGWFILKPHTSEVVPVETTTPSEVVIPVQESTPLASEGSSSTGTATYYTAAQVRGHANTDSCWSIVNGKVYDLTPWIQQHPGGQNAITQLCGIDGSKNFNGQHGGQSRPEQELAGFLVGILK